VVVDWGKRGEYIAKHGVTAVQASEALTDPDAVVFDPDYNSRTGVKRPRPPLLPPRRPR
jgi:uncharacterized DUF497 family protein